LNHASFVFDVSAFNTFHDEIGSNLGFEVSNIVLSEEELSV